MVLPVKGNSHHQQHRASPPAPLPSHPSPFIFLAPFPFCLSPELLPPLQCGLMAVGTRSALSHRFI